MLPFGYATQTISDFDNDGQLDILFGDVKMGVFRMLSTLVSSSIAMDLELFQIKDGAGNPAQVSSLAVRPDSSSEGVFFPAVLVGDINADGFKDLLVGQNWNELLVYLGDQQTLLLQQAPVKVRATLPNDERNIQLLDLNRDGKQDVVINLTAKKAVNRVEVLIAN